MSVYQFKVESCDCTKIDSFKLIVHWYKNYIIILV